MATPYPTVRLGEVLTKAEEWVPIHPEERYRQVTVRLWGKGVAQRDEVMGAQIAADRRLAVRAGQFILSRIDARNGAFGLVPDFLDGAIVSTDFPVFVPNPTRLLPQYLAWLSRTQDFVDLCKRASEGTTNRVRLKESRFLTAEIPLPPLVEQMRIVARVEYLARKIDEAQQTRYAAAKGVEAFRRAVLRSAFGNHAASTSVPLESVCAEIVDNLHSNPLYSDVGVLCVRSPDIGWGRLNLVNTLRTSEAEYGRRTVRGEPRPGDVVLVREGGGTGKAAVVEEGQRFSLGQRVMLLRPNTEMIAPRFLLYQLLSPQVYEDQILPQISGSASPHLNISTLRRFELRVPRLAEQHRILSQIDSALDQLDRVQQLQLQTSSELGALLSSILDRAFSGGL